MKIVTITLILFLATVSFAQVVTYFEVGKSINYKGEEYKFHFIDNEFHFFFSKNRNSDLHYIERFDESSFELLNSAEIEFKTIGNFKPMFKVGKEVIYVFTMETKIKIREAYLKVTTVDKSTLKVLETKVVYTYTNTHGLPEPRTRFSDDNEYFTIEISESEYSRKNIVVYLFNELEQVAVWDINEITEPYWGEIEELSSWSKIKPLNNGVVFFDLSATVVGSTTRKEIYLSTRDQDYTRFTQHTIEFPMGYKDGYSGITYDEINDFAYLHNSLRKSDTYCAIVVKQIKISSGETVDETRVNFVKDDQVIPELIPFSNGFINLYGFKILYITKTGEDWYIIYRTEEYRKGIYTSDDRDRENHVIRVNDGDLIGSVHMSHGLGTWWSKYWKISNGKLLIWFSGSVSSLSWEELNKNALKKKDKIWSFDWLDMSSLESHSTRDLTVSAILRAKNRNLKIDLYHVEYNDVIRDIQFSRLVRETKSYEVGNLVVD